MSVAEDESHGGRTQGSELLGKLATGIALISARQPTGYARRLYGQRPVFGREALKATDNSTEAKCQERLGVRYGPSLNLVANVRLSVSDDITDLAIKPSATQFSQLRSSHDRVAAFLPAQLQSAAGRNVTSPRPRTKHERIEIWQSHAAVQRIDRECECDPTLDQAADIHFKWMEVEYRAGGLGHLWHDGQAGKPCSFQRIYHMEIVRSRFGEVLPRVGARIKGNESV